MEGVIAGALVFTGERSRGRARGLSAQSHGDVADRRGKPYIIRG